MCGICGIFSNAEIPELKERVIAMRERLTHRGPDSAGLFIGHHGGLGVRRLSIVDISGSDQPLYNEDKSIALVYNGMIYNFRELRDELVRKGHMFVTHGDGEVIVHLYEEEGVNCFARLHGMFAIALFDQKKSELYLIRDQVGIKPLYFADRNGMLYFASEIKTLIAADRESWTVDRRSIELFLAYNYIPGGGTLYEEIKVLRPGHYLCYDAEGRISQKQYWALEKSVAESRERDQDPDDIVDRLDHLLRQSIERHLIADVEVGCFLSGGLDSSAIVHYVKECPRGRLKTFTIGYDDHRYDEREFARAVAQKYETEHVEIICREHDAMDFLEALPSLGDMPIGDQASVSTYVISKLAREHVKVCLSGEGGDELFAGYPTYTANALYPTFNHVPDACVRLFLKWLSKLPASDKKVGIDYKIRRFFEGVLLHDIGKAHAFWRMIVPHYEREQIFKNSLIGQQSAEDIFVPYYDLLDDKGATARSRSFADFTTWLPNNNLLRADIFSMKNSLEVRVPLLDLPLVNYVMGLPFAIKFKQGTPKYLFKRLLRGKLEDRLITRKKAGWHLPLAPWFKGKMYGYARDILASRHFLFDEILKQEFCLSLLDEHKNGRQNNSFKIWGLLVLMKHLIQGR